MKEQVYQHYSKEEAGFIDLVYSWIQQVENRYAPFLTGFLTPRQAMIVQQIVQGQDEVRLQVQGGYETAERTRALLMPSYYQAQFDDFDLTLLKVKFPSKFAEISHGKILGTLIGAGIDRDRIGDIISDGQDWQVVVDQTIKNYLQTHVRKIGNVGVQLEDLNFDQLLQSNEKWETVTIISSSLRLDTLISKVYNLSRQRAKDAVAGGLVKMNFVEMERADAEVRVNDIVSLRKFGRFWIKSIDGMTKKDNYRLSVNVLER